MKNEKLCFSKRTGLIVLVGFVLVEMVLFAQTANKPTSTNSRAEAPKVAARIYTYDSLVLRMGNVNDSSLVTKKNNANSLLQSAIQTRKDTLATLSTFWDQTKEDEARIKMLSQITLYVKLNKYRDSREKYLAPYQNELLKSTSMDSSKSYDDRVANRKKNLIAILGNAEEKRQTLLGEIQKINSFDDGTSVLSNTKGTLGRRLNQFGHINSAEVAKKYNTEIADITSETNIISGALPILGFKNIGNHYEYIEQKNPSLKNATDDFVGTLTNIELQNNYLVSLLSNRNLSTRAAVAVLEKTVEDAKKFEAAQKLIAERAESHYNILIEVKNRYKSLSNTIVSASIVVPSDVDLIKSNLTSSIKVGANSSLTKYNSSLKAYNDSLYEFSNGMDTLFGVTVPKTEPSSAQVNTDQSPLPYKYLGNILPWNGYKVNTNNCLLHNDEPTGYEGIPQTLRFKTAMTGSCALTAKCTGVCKGLSGTQYSIGVCAPEGGKLCKCKIGGLSPSWEDSDCQP